MGEEIPTGYDCPCFAENSAPYWYRVDISEVEDCPGREGSKVNGMWLLPIYDRAESYCEWQITDYDVRISFLAGLSGLTLEGKVFVEGTGWQQAFVAFGHNLTCMEVKRGSIENGLNYGNCYYLQFRGYGGSGSYGPWW